MRWAEMAQDRDIDGTILGAPAEGTRNFVRGHPEGDSVSGQVGRGEATPVASPLLFQDGLFGRVR